MTEHVLADKISSLLIKLLDGVDPNLLKESSLVTGIIVGMMDRAGHPEMATRFLSSMTDFYRGKPCHNNEARH